MSSRAVARKPSAAPVVGEIAGFIREHINERPGCLLVWTVALWPDAFGAEISEAVASAVQQLQAAVPPATERRRRLTSARVRRCVERRKAGKALYRVEGDGEVLDLLVRFEWLRHLVADECHSISTGSNASE